MCSEYSPDTLSTCRRSTCPGHSQNQPEQPANLLVHQPTTSHTFFCRVLTSHYQGIHLVSPALQLPEDFTLSTSAPSGRPSYASSRGECLSLAVSSRIDPNSSLAASSPCLVCCTTAAGAHQFIRVSNDQLYLLPFTPLKLASSSSLSLNFGGQQVLHFQAPTTPSPSLPIWRQVTTSLKHTSPALRIRLHRI